jgi:hypothetical protein
MLLKFYSINVLLFTRITHLETQTKENNDVKKIGRVLLK